MVLMEMPRELTPGSDGAAFYAPGPPIKLDKFEIQPSPYDEREVRLTCLDCDAMLEDVIAQGLGYLVSVAEAHVCPPQQDQS